MRPPRLAEETDAFIEVSSSGDNSTKRMTTVARCFALERRYCSLRGIREDGRPRRLFGLASRQCSAGRLRAGVKPGTAGRREVKLEAEPGGLARPRALSTLPAGA
jgi:hypothetical protein